MLLALLCIYAGNAMADQPPWDAGAGIATVDFPAYRGSGQLDFGFVANHG